MPPREVHFFDDDEFYKRGLKWYTDELYKGGEALRTNGSASQIMLGEKTPEYSYLPKCEKRISDTAPQAKLIWIFRNPVDRSFSDYLHERAKGTELLSFESAVEREKERMQRNPTKGYVERSKYIHQVERFQKHFPLDQMCFLLFEEFVEAPEDGIDKVADFLEIPPFGEALPSYHSNPTVLPRWPVTLWLARNVLDLGDTIYRVVRHSGKVRQSIYRMIRKINLKFSKEKPEISPDMRHRLAKEFKPYNQRLAAVTDLDVSTWHGVD
jgi:hypothetical protein